MSYLDELRAYSEKTPERSTDNTDKTGSVGFVSAPSGHILPHVALRQAQGGLAGIDAATPLHGIPAARWRQLVDDACWLFEGFAEIAFRDGWTIGELFGLWWWRDDAGLHLKDGYGGIANRLQGSRSLKMTADRAHWRLKFTDAPESFNRGAYPDLRPFWEVLP